METVIWNRREAERAADGLKVGNAPGVNGITAEMLIYEGHEKVELCIQARIQGTVPEVQRKTINVPLSKNKGSKDECSRYGVISVQSVPWKVYERLLTKLKGLETDKDI